MYFNISKTICSPNHLFMDFLCTPSRLYKLLQFCLLLCGFAVPLYFRGQPVASDRYTVAVAPAYDSVGGFHRFWFGEGYRKLWAAPVELKRFDFNRQSGGISIQRLGGGLQTKSLHFKDAAGKDWVLRSVQKYPERGLAPKFQQTILRQILHDQVITVHPFAALTVPPLAEAIGVRHTNPQMVYIPDDPDLGAYRDDFKNTVMLMEERALEDSIRTDNTVEVQEKLRADNDNQIDQKALLRARLLDMLLGDWDRHENQWRWERKRGGGDEATYIPIPRDRDYVYYNTSGLLPWIVSRQWLMSRFQGFDENIRDVNGFNFNSRFFDRYFLNELSEEDWRKEIGFVQQQITDGLIEQAIRRMPDTIVALSGQRIIETLKARRANLPKIGMDYYRFLSSDVDIPASNKHELFDVNYLGDSVRLTITKLKKDHTRDRVIYQRTFDPDVTKEIRLYGLDGSDVFTANGGASSSIKVRMIGGDGVDSFYVDPANKTKAKIYVYDRKDQENMLSLNGAKERMSTDSLVNEYEPRSFRYSRTGLIFSIFSNMDQGALTTVGWIWEKQGFRKSPYASRHLLTANYSPARGSFGFRYTGDWLRVFGKYGLLVDAVSRGPHNVSNFFGIGNESDFANPDKSSLGFYRNRYDMADLDIRLKRALGKRVTITGGIAGQYYTSSAENNQDKFLHVYDQQMPAEDVFGTRYYTGFGAGLEMVQSLSPYHLARGFGFRVDIKTMKQTGGGDRAYTSLLAEAGISVPLTKDSGLVFMDRMGGGATWGDPEFYQMMKLGGTRNLRGFNTNRFTGNSVFYNNTELAIRLFNFQSVFFPGSFGLVGFYDFGRVWVPDESSSTLHHGYGGGVYLTPANVVLLRVLVGGSKELAHWYFNLSVGL
jgi:hypothetical protein